MTDQQVMLLRQKRMEGKTQQTAAAMAGMSERSARKWQCGPLPSETKHERWRRTRPDPFDGVLEEEIEPLLRGEGAGRLRATTIIEWLEELYPGRFSASHLYTLPVASPKNVTEISALGTTANQRQFRHCMFVRRSFVGSGVDQFARHDASPLLHLPLQSRGWARLNRSG